MERRTLLGRLSALPLLAFSGARSLSAQAPQSNSRKMKVLMKSAWGSDDPTRASFPFAHALAFADAGHEVQIFLLGEATYLMRKATVDAIMPVGWPPLAQLLEKVTAHKIPVFS